MADPKKMSLDEIVIERDGIQVQIERLNARFIELGKELESRRAVNALEDDLKSVQKKLDDLRAARKEPLRVRLASLISGK